MYCRNDSDVLFELFRAAGGMILRVVRVFSVVNCRFSWGVLGKLCSIIKFVL